MKLWRNQKGLDFPSFYLELVVIEALKGSGFVGINGDLPRNVIRVLEYLQSDFSNARIVDPANTNNIISDDLNSSEKALIMQAAKKSSGGKWGDFIS